MQPTPPRPLAPAATVAMLLIAAAAAAHAADPPGPKVVAYVPNWIDLTAFAGTIDYASVTHLNVAFENPTNDAGDLSFNPQDGAQIAKAREHRVKVLVSIGGGAASGDKV